MKPIHSPSFDLMRQNINRNKKVVPHEGGLISLDPGHTTGWAYWKPSTINAGQSTFILAAAGQVQTWPLEDAVKAFQDMFEAFKPSKVVFESYNVYDWKLDEHSFSSVPTIQVIGCLQTIAIQKGIPTCFQSAQIAKAFCTDDKLKSWGFYLQGLRHARDACRHGAYYLLFGQSKQQ